MGLERGHAAVQAPRRGSANPMESSGVKISHRKRSIWGAIENTTSLFSLWMLAASKKVTLRKTSLCCEAIPEGQVKVVCNSKPSSYGNVAFVEECAAWDISI